MAETSGPFDGADLTEADWELMLANLVDGVIGTPGGTALKATPSGSTARGVDLAAGTALARGHWYRSTAVITLTSDANATGAARTDRAVLRLDRSANTVTLVKLTGTAGAGPPALTDNATTTERPLWRWTISPGATVATNLVDERLWAPRPVRVYKDAANLPIDVQPGDLLWELDTDRLTVWNGVYGALVFENSGELYLPPANPSVWEERSPLSFATKVTGVVYVELNLRRIGSALQTDSSDTSQGSLLVVLPSEMRPFREIQKPVTLTAGISARIRYQTDGGVYLNAPSSTVGIGRFVRVQHSFLGA